MVRVEPGIEDQCLEGLLMIPIPSGFPEKMYNENF
jgi:hypothetical protein